MRTFTVNRNDAGQRLDKYLLKAVKLLPITLMYKYIRTKKIKVNRKRTEPQYMLAEGDTVELFIKEEFFSKPKADEVYRTIVPKLDIIYENADMILCDKRPGVIVHEDDSEDVNTLINHIKAYLYKKGEWNPDKENTFAPALCNRIDRNTGGIVIAAKNAEALRRINSQIKNNEITKKYLCAVHGILNKKSGTLTGYLTKDSKNNTVNIYTEKQGRKNAKEIITKYRVVDQNMKKDLSLVEVELVTGRTHQIRAHFSSIGHPLLGDGKYGINRDDRKIGYKYQALYSYCITIDGSTYYADRSKIWFLKEFE